MYNKLNYWNMYVKQIPRLSTWAYTPEGYLEEHRRPSQIVRCVGHKHTYPCLQWLAQTAYSNPGDTFLIFSSDMIAFQENWFPANAIPVLQVDSHRSYKNNITDYLDFCVARGIECPTLSIFCNHTITVNKHIKWLLLSGDKFTNLLGNIDTNYNRRKYKIPVYVERFSNSVRLPSRLQLRQVPTFGSNVVTLNSINNIDKVNNDLQIAI